MMHNLGSLRPSSDGSITQQQAMNSDVQHSSPSRKRLTLDAARKLAEGNITPTQLLDFLAKMDRWAVINNGLTGTRSSNTHARQQFKRHDASLVSGNCWGCQHTLQRVEISCDNGAVPRMQPQKTQPPCPCARHGCNMKARCLEKWPGTLQHHKQPQVARRPAYISAKPQRTPFMSHHHMHPVVHAQELYLSDCMS